MPSKHGPVRVRIAKYGNTVACPLPLKIARLLGMEVKATVEITLLSNRALKISRVEALTATSLKVKKVEKP